MGFAKKTDEIAVIKPANILRMKLRVVGLAPYVQHKFSEKAKKSILDNQTATVKESKSKSSKPSRVLEDDFEQAQHKSTEGWVGIPCSAFRAAMIDACRVAGLQMTTTKMCVFVQPDGFDAEDGTPLVKLIAKAPERHTVHVRLATGVADVRVRPMWRSWSCDVTVDFDADKITAESVVNLLDRAGRQVGVGEGRPFSKQSVGQGWGIFQVQEPGGDAKKKR